MTEVPAGSSQAAGVATAPQPPRLPPPRPFRSPLHPTVVANHMYHWSSVSEIIQIDVFDENSVELPTRFMIGMQRLLDWAGIQEDSLRIFLTLTYLAGEPRIWADFFYTDFKSFEDFRRRFLIRFWNSSKQREVRWQMYTGRWSPGGAKSKVDYFTEMVLKCRTLLPEPSDVELMFAMSEHFPPVVRDRILYGPQKAIRSTFEARVELRKMELEDGGAGSSGATLGTLWGDPLAI